MKTLESTDTLASESKATLDSASLESMIRSYINDYLLQKHYINNSSSIYDEVLTIVKKTLIETVLKNRNQNQTKTSMTLGISRSTLRKMMHEYGLLKYRHHQPRISYK